MRARFQSPRLGEGLLLTAGLPGRQHYRRIAAGLPAARGGIWLRQHHRRCHRRRLDDLDAGCITTLWSQLQAQGKSRGAYLDAMPVPCSATTSTIALDDVS